MTSANIEVSTCIIGQVEQLQMLIDTSGATHKSDHLLITVTHVEDVTSMLMTHVGVVTTHKS